MTERPEQLQASSDNLPPTEPIDLPPRYTLDLDLHDQAPSPERTARRARDVRIAGLVHEAIDRGVRTTDPDLGLSITPRHRGRRARRQPPVLGVAALLAAQGIVGAIVGCLGTLACLGLGSL